MSALDTEATVVNKVVMILDPLLCAQCLLYLVPFAIFPTCSRFFWLGPLVLLIAVALYLHLWSHVTLQGLTWITSVQTAY